MSQQNRRQRLLRLKNITTYEDKSMGDNLATVVNTDSHLVSLFVYVLDVNSKSIGIMPNIFYSWKIT